jgi:hypothetical protein
MNEPGRDQERSAGRASHAVDVSTAAACSVVLTPAKREAVKGYIARLGPALHQKYGRRKHYAPREVRETAVERGLSLDYMCWAFMLYSSPADFHEIHTSAGEVCDPVAMHEAVASAFFGGNSAIDVADVADAISTGTAGSIEASGSGLTGWLADVDWSSLWDWS